METDQDREGFFELGDEIKHNGTPLGKGFLDSDRVNLKQTYGFSMVVTTYIDLKNESVIEINGQRCRVKTRLADDNGVFKYGVIEHN